MYKCLDCGLEFDTPAVIEEDRGEFWGVRCYEKLQVCPCCHESCFREKRDEDEDYEEE